MGTRSLERFFHPETIAVIGASERKGSLGGAVLRNLLAGGYEGDILPVNSKGYASIQGVKAYSRLGQLKVTPDLAIICTPADTVPKIIKQLHSLGVEAAMVLTGGIARARSWQFRPSSERMDKVVLQTRMRILGPDCLGLLIPHRHINASFLHVPVHPGHVAYIGQSGTLASGVMDWAYSRKIGFSHVVTLGRSEDVTLPDLIDYIAQQPKVRTMLVQLDEIRSGRELVRSLRAASRQKLVLAVKNNRFPESPLNTIDAPKGLARRDLLIDEIFARAGVLRVNATDELFDCVDVLGNRRERFGPRLAIIANGRGPAILAMDRLLHDRGTLADLSGDCQAKLREILPDYIKATNPVLLNPELKPEQLSAVASAVLADRQVDALLVVYTPSLGSDPKENADALIEVAARTQKTVLTSWLGEYSVEEARASFDRALIPTFDTPDNAIKSYMYMVQHQRTQDLLRETPESIEIPVSAQHSKLDREFQDNYSSGDFLPPQEAYRLLNSYGFACADNIYRSSLDALVRDSSKVPGPWVLRVHHRDYLYPFAYGNNPRERIRSVVRDLEQPGDLRPAADSLKSLIRERFPGSPVLGYTLQTMHRALDNLQFSFGIGRDNEIGPFLFFGGGGSTADILVDRQVALPPLNANLAEKLIRRSHFYEVLQERSEDPERDLLTLERWLVALSHMALNHPWLAGLEVNAIRQQVGRYRVIGVAAEVGRHMRCAILPYPTELEAGFSSPRGTQYHVRPIRGEDEPLLRQFYEGLSAESLRLRFFNARRRFDHNELARLTQIDYDREMALVAINGDRLYGVVRVWVDPDDVAAEFSVIVDDNCRGERLGHHLMSRIIGYLKERGVLQIYGTVLPENGPMLRLAERLGFSQKLNSADGVVEVAMTLNTMKHAWQRRRMYSV
ncbi:GNAT family N-acetyltransferase [Thalassolituus sp.]|uniref:bifunctional acetate--CoA ligase family protein/GNAT family N-acetyltransferase n=1 Tax=Thalassolituus sp. TaxID=2030822 RepID=UPI0035178941